jgi:beta-barrel assembly-enhancing protease
MIHLKRLVAALLLVVFPLNLMALTLTEEKKYGREIFVEISKSAGLATDPYVSIYLDVIKSRLEAVANLPLPIKLSLISSDTLDAFATVGGYVFITTGALEQCDKEEEIAGVLAHEFGHVGRRHVAQNVEKQKFVNWGMLAAMLLAMLAPTSQGKAAVMATSMGAGQAVALKYTREAEEDADRVGLVTAEKAGYSGLGTVSFLKKLRASGLEKTVPQYLLTHPYSDDRITKIEQSATMTKTRVDDSLFPFVVARVKILGSPLNVQIEDVWMKRYQKEPENPVNAYGAALIYSIKGKTDQAEGILRKVNSPHRPLFLGEFFVGNNRPREAVELLKDDTNPISRFYLARAYEMQGDLKMAGSIYMELLGYAGTFPDLYQRAGMVLGRMQEEGRGYENLGRYYFVTGKDKQAKMNLEKAVSKYGINSGEAKEVLELLDTLEPKPPNSKKKSEEASS